MKKTLFITALLLIFSVAALPLINVRLNSDKDNVTISENIVYGDKSLANGITVRSRVHYDNHLFWDTSYTLGYAPRIKTEYNYYSSPKYNSFIDYHGIVMGARPAYGCNYSIPAEEQKGLARAYKELFDETEPGTEKRRVVYLSDYYDYYPFKPNFDLPDVFFSGNDYENLSGDHVGGEKYVLDKFSEYFRIPMQESEAVEIYVAKDSLGRLSMSGSGGSTDVSTEAYNTYTVSAFNNGMCYFTISNKMSDGEYIDMSLIPGGYGIYCFNYSKYKSKNGTYTTGIDADSLRTVFSLPQNVSVIEMWLSADGSKLHYISYEENEKMCFTLLDTADMKVLQHTVVADGRYFDDVFVYDDFFVVVNVKGAEAVVFEYTEKGIYNHEFTVSLMQLRDRELYMRDVVMDYDGEYLVITDSLYEPRFHSTEICDFYVAVYSKNGLGFLAEYKTSLGVNPYTSRYKANCLPFSPGAFEVKWD